MTICVAVQVNDCLVFAADSAVTLSYGLDKNGREIINVLPHGNGADHLSHPRFAKSVHGLLSVARLASH